MTNDKIYLDYNATTPIAPEVLEVMLPYFKEKFYNPSSMYSAALDIQSEIKKARISIADYLGAGSEDEIIFTGSSTESTNYAIKGVLKTHPERNHIITTAVEHSSVYETCKELERDSYSVSFIGVNSKGEINEKEFLDSITNKTAVISMIHANNETGVIFPIGRLSKLAKKINPDIIFHTDATQTTGKMDINLNSEEYKYIDLLSTSAHKIYAPKGVGLLYIRKGTRLRKFLTGGHHEFNKRAGTLNVPFVIGFAKAFELAKNESENEHNRLKEYLDVKGAIDFLKKDIPEMVKHFLNENNRLKEYRDRIEKELKQVIPYMYINGEGADRLATTTNLAFDCIEGESILQILDELGFCVSSGSACTSGSLEPSHVLKAMKVPSSAAHSSLRVSIGRYTKERDIELFIRILPDVIAKLRNMSPFWDRETNCPNARAMQYKDTIKQAHY